MSKVISLFSGSTGNSFYISNKNTSVLIDAGVSAKMLSDKMAQYDISPEKIDAVFLTHEHIDHIKGAKVFCDKYNIPLFASEGTLTEVEKNGLLPIKSSVYKTDECGNEIGSLFISRFDTPHDCVQPNGYTVETEDGKKIAICTDLGYVSETVKNALLGSDFVYLESNHDLDMLKNGNYPAMLKRRISGLFGHLSNDACDEFMTKLIESGTKEFMLGHISRENNSVALALSCARKFLFSKNMKENEDYLLSAADVGGNGCFRVL